MLVHRFKAGRERRDAARRKRSEWIREFVRRAQTNPHYAADWVAGAVAVTLPAGAPTTHRFRLDDGGAGSFDLLSADRRRIYFSAFADVSSSSFRRPIVESTFLAWDGARMVERPVPDDGAREWPIAPGRSAVVGRAATLGVWGPIASRLSLRQLVALSCVSRGMRDLVRESGAAASRVPPEWRGYGGRSDLQMATLFSPWEMPWTPFERVPNDQDLMRAAFMHWFSRSRRYRDADLQLRVIVAPRTKRVPMLRIHVAPGAYYDLRMCTSRAKYFDLNGALSSSTFAHRFRLPVLLRAIRCE